MESSVPQINGVLTTTPGPFGPFWPCLKKKKLLLKMLISRHTLN